ncbi:MAG: ankyrin repeat protein [Myxococcota bacterium]|jgi:ankyrin repeat protein
MRRGQMKTALLLPLALLMGALVGAPEAPVAEAAESGDLELVRSLVRDGADVNAAQGDGTTALHWAAMRGDAEMATVLMYAGAHAESTTRLGGYTPLHLASQAGHDGAVEALLAGGAHADAVSTTGVSSLHLAAESGSVTTVLALIGQGAAVDVQDLYQGRTPLMFATASNRVEVADALLAAGADVSVTTTVVDYAERAEADNAERRQRARMVAAAKGDDPDAAAQRGLGPYGNNQQQAGQQGTAAQAAGSAAEPDAAKPDATEPDETEPKEDEPEEVMPEPHPDPDQATPAEPRDPRAYAPNDSAQVSVSAMSYDALVGRQGGLNALHYAARDGRMDIATRLLDAGADINALTDGDESTALLISVINGNFDLAETLLERGANPNLLSEDGAGPLFATLNTRWAFRTWYPQPTAWQQQETDYLQLLSNLLEAGAEPNIRLEQHVWYAVYNAGRIGVDFGGATPFWRAAYSLDVKAMRLLAEYGADPNISTRKPASRRFRRADPDEEEEEDPSGLPDVEVGGAAIHPLHGTTGVGYGTSRVGQQHVHAPDAWLSATMFLVEEMGVDVNVRDHDGYSAVHNAAARGDDELIRYLVDKGADVTFISRRGQTTVDMANGPQQRVQPFPSTMALLEGLGAENNHNCISC